MLNREFILKQVQPYLNAKREISEFEFNELFSFLTKREQYEIINIFIEEDIEYVDEKEEEAQLFENAPLLIASRSTDIDYTGLLHLTNEQLCHMYQAGDLAALAAIIEKNKRFIYKLALKLMKLYRGQDLSEEDLFQEGTLGIIEAASRFSNDMDNTFITYAWHWIRQKMVRAIVDTGYSIRIPVHLFDKISAINRIRSVHFNATVDEITEIYNKQQSDPSRHLLPSAVSMYITYAEEYLNCVSLNEKVGESEDSELMAFIPEDAATIEEIVILNDMVHQIDLCLDELTPKEKEIVEKRFGLHMTEPMTLMEVGESLGVTRERVRQIEGKAIKRLKSIFSSRHMTDY